MGAGALAVLTVNYHCWRGADMRIVYVPSATRAAPRVRHDPGLTRLPTLCRLSIMGADSPRITGPTLKVLGALLSSPTKEVSGSEIAVTTKLASGTLYPILFRLESARWVISHWEAADPREIGRPRRRLYQLTGLGARKAVAAFKEVSAGLGELAWGS